MHLSKSDWAHVEERAQHFTGREWVFERLRTFLASDARLLGIVAPPGSGKTAIAARLAQASAGHLKGEPALPVPAGTLAAAVFCRAGQVSLLEVAQDLADQLSTALDGFAAEQRQTVAPQMEISDVHAGAAEVHPGGSVIGVKVDLARLGPERAFADGLALPLKRLAETPGFVPPVLLVDSLDEAYASPVAQQLPGLLADLGGARLILTTRDDPRVLAAIGLETAVAAGRAMVIHLIDDAPAGIDEVADYASAQLRGRGPDEAIEVLARRVGEAAAGNFLYAYYVVNELLASSALGGLDAAAAADLPLPAGGLPGVYGEFLRRVVGTDRGRWRTAVREILAPLAVALGEGLDTTQLAAAGTILAGQSLSPMTAGDVTEDLGQFLQGSRPDGPFRLYHRSFAEFLLDPTQTSGFRINAAEAHAAIVDALTPRDAAGSPEWSVADPYAIAYSPAHLTEALHATRLAKERREIADRLSMLLTDFEYVEVKTAGPGIDAALRDYQVAIPLLGEQPNVAATYRILDQEAHHLRGWDHGALPTFFGQQVFNRAKALGETVIASAARARLGAIGGAWFELRWRTDAVGQGLVRTMMGHTDAVWAIALTPDNRQVVSGSKDRTVRVWDLETGAQVRTMRGHKGSVLFVAVTPDGHRIVSASADQSIKVWDPDSGSLIRTITGHTGPVHALALTSDGKRLVSVSEDRTVRVWDLDSGTVVRVIDQTMALGGIAVVPGTARAACIHSNGALTVWELDTGQAVRSMEAVGRSHLPTRRTISNAIAVTPDGRAVVAPTADRRGIVVWDLETGAHLRTIPGHQGWVRGLAVTRDGRRLVSGSSDRTIRMWNIETGDELSFLGSHEAIVSAVALTSDDRSVISASQDGTIRVWDVGGGSNAAAKIGHRRRVDTIAMTRDGSWAVTGGDDAIKVWDLGTGIERTNAPIGVGPVAVSRDGRAVCLSRADDPIVWDVATGEAVLELAVGSVDEEGLDLVGVGIAGSSLVLAERDRVRVWDLATGAARDLDALDDGEEITEVALSADGRRAVVATLDSAIILWDLDAGGALRRRPGYHGDGLGLTPDGRLAIWVCEEHGLAIHDLETGEIRESGGGLAEVYALYVASDGGHVVTAGADRAVRVWNLTSWDTEALVALDGHVWCVAMSDDGCLAAGVGAGDVWCLDYRNGKLQRT